MGLRPGTRGALAVSFGNGLRAQLQNVFFLNLQTEPCSFSPRMGGICQPSAPGKTVTFVVQPPPTLAPASPSPS